MATTDILLPFILTGLTLAAVATYIVFGGQRKRSEPYSRRRITGVRGELISSSILGLAFSAQAVSAFAAGNIIFGVPFTLFAVIFILNSVVGVLCKEMFLGKPAAGAPQSEFPDTYERETTETENTDGTVTQTTNTHKVVNKGGFSYEESTSISRTTPPK